MCCSPRPANKKRLEAVRFAKVLTGKRAKFTAVAAELAKSTLATSAQLSDVRHAIDAQPLQEE